MLKGYQEQAIEFVKEKKKCALFLQMGLGKTVVVLTALQELIREGKVKKAIVIAPLQVANSVWEQEAKKWEHITHIKTNICTGTPQKREKMLRDDDANVFIINVSNVKWMIEKGLWAFDCFVIDESTLFKSSKSKRFRLLSALIVKHSNDIPYRILLTGTPAPNSLMDLWTQTYLLDEGERLEVTKQSFLDKYFDYRIIYVRNKSGEAVGIKDHYPNDNTKELIYKQIDDICFSVDIKTNDFTVKYIDKNLCFSEELRRDYESFIVDKVLDIGKYLIPAQTAAVLVNKLQQFTSGAMCVDPDLKLTDKFDEIDNTKTLALKEIVENSSDNFLVAVKYKNEKMRIKRDLKYAVELKNQDDIDAWNKGKIRVLIVHPQSCGHGLNLQFGGSKVVWYSLPWSLEQYMQTNARLVRQGQINDIEIIHLMIEDTVDDDIKDALNYKYTTQKEFLDHIINSCRKRYVNNGIFFNKKILTI